MVQTFEDFDTNSFKSVVINELCGNNEIVALLDKDYIDVGGSLLNKRIFPFLRNPKTIEDTSPFICFKVDHIRNRNVFVETIDVIIYVVCHEREMLKKVQDYKTGHIKSGTIIDNLAEEIKKTLVGLDTNWIGELKLFSNTEDILNYEYPYRVLTFTANKESYAHYE